MLTFISDGMSEHCVIFWEYLLVSVCFLNTQRPYLRAALHFARARRGGSGTLKKKLFRVHKDLDSLIGMNCVCSRVRDAAAPCSARIRLCIVHGKWKVNLGCLCMWTKPFALTWWADGVKCCAAVVGRVPGGEKSRGRWCYVRHVDLKIKQQQQQKKLSSACVLPSATPHSSFNLWQKHKQAETDCGSVLVSNIYFENLTCQPCRPCRQVWFLFFRWLWMFWL